MEFSGLSDRARVHKFEMGICFVGLLCNILEEEIRGSSIQILFLGNSPMKFLVLVKCKGFDL